MAYELNMRIDWNLVEVTPDIGVELIVAHVVLNLVGAICVFGAKLCGEVIVVDALDICVAFRFNVTLGGIIMEMSKLGGNFTPFELREIDTCLYCC